MTPGLGERLGGAAGFGKAFQVGEHVAGADAGTHQDGIKPAGQAVCGNQLPAVRRRRLSTGKPCTGTPEGRLVLHFGGRILQTEGMRPSAAGRPRLARLILPILPVQVDEVYAPD